MAEAPQEGSYFDLKQQLAEVLTSLVDAREAARVAAFFRDKVMPDLFDRWCRDYPRVEPKLECHLAMQAKLAALGEVREAVEELAKGLEPDEDNARAIMAEMQGILGDLRADQVVAGEM